MDYAADAAAASTVSLNGEMDSAGRDVMHRREQMEQPNWQTIRRQFFVFRILSCVCEPALNDQRICRPFCWNIDRCLFKKNIYIPHPHTRCDSSTANIWCMKNNYSNTDKRANKKNVPISMLLVAATAGEKLKQIASNMPLSFGSLWLMCVCVVVVVFGHAHGVVTEAGSAFTCPHRTRHPIHWQLPPWCPSNTVYLRGSTYFSSPYKSQIPRRQ